EDQKQRQRPHPLRFSRKALIAAFASGEASRSAKMRLSSAMRVSSAPRCVALSSALVSRIDSGGSAASARALRSATSSTSAAGSSPGARGFRKSTRSFPALKHSRVPCTSTARTSAAAFAAASASPSRRYISAVKAFFFSGRSSAIRATPPAVSARTKLVVFHLLAQRQLRELARRGVRQLGDEHHVVG